MRDSTARIAEDIYCCKCGYNLRTLRADRCCTECGTLIRDTLRSQRKRPRRLRHVIMDWPDGVLILATIGGLALLLVGVLAFGYQGD